MHELSIAAALSQLAQEEASRLGAVHVLHLRVRVGALRQVDPAMLKEAFEMARGGRLAGADLAVTVAMPAVRCLHCGAGEKLETFSVHCRRCGSTDVQVEGGDELELTSMEFDTECDEAPQPQETGHGRAD